MNTIIPAFTKIDPKNLSKEALNRFLIVAACKNDCDGIKYFVNLGADVAYSHFYGSVIDEVINHQNYDMVCYLLEHDTYGKLHNKNMLFRLIRTRNIKTVDFMLKRMKILGISYAEYFDEAIRIATRNSDYEMLNLFFAYGAPLEDEILDAYIYAIDDLLFTEATLIEENSLETLIKDLKAIQFAAKHGKTRLTKFLLNKGAYGTVNNNYALKQACLNWDLEMAKALINHGADCTANRSYALRIVTQNLNTENDEVLELLQLLVDNGADCTTCENEALQNAVRNGHIRMVKFFLKHGADIAVQEHVALRIAIAQNNKQMVKFLLYRGADCTACNNRALIIAMQHNNVDIMHFLLTTCNLSITVLNFVLSATISYKHPSIKIAELLLRFGADPKADNNKLLKDAITSNSPEMVELLVKYGASYDIETIEYAVAHDNYSILMKMYDDLSYQLFDEND